MTTYDSQPEPDDGELRDSLPTHLNVPSSLTLPLIPVSTLHTVPRPRYIVKDLLYERTLAQMFGPSGAYKSFIALTLAAHVADNTPLWGRRVRGGATLYVCAEGAGALQYRVRAWEQHHERPMTGVTVIPTAVQIANYTEFQALRQAVAQLRPSLVILDTQAQCTVGINENDNAEMMRMVRALAQLAHESDACVLLIHHTGHNGERGRGASAVHGGLDTEIAVLPHGSPGELAPVTLSLTKSKDGPCGSVAHLVPRRLHTGFYDEDGDPVYSLAVSEDSGADDPTIGVRTPQQWAHVLIQAGILVPMGRGKLCAAAEEAGILLPGKTAVQSQIAREHKRALGETV